MASTIMSSLLATASCPPSLSSKTSFSPQNARRRPTTYRQWKLVNLSIRSSGDNSTDESPLIKLDRRNMLIGGGMYGTTLALIQDQKAVATPISPPNLSKCNSSSDGDVLYPCCPPYAFGVLKPEEIPDYQIPSFTTLRKRKPARDLSDGELSNLKSAISKMKNLGGTDPWNFVQQANIHCAFCNGAYDQVGFDKFTNDRSKNVPLQVHASSIFLPWHRWYIYFYERILGKLMGDESFALPYWDYDHPDGMEFPKIYDETPLLDETRAEHARAGNYVDLLYSIKDCYTPRPKDEVIKGNLCYFQRIFSEGAKDPTLFIGKTPEAGQESAVAGSLENLHNVVHQWVGKCESPNFDMGNFITAARDPIFYAHHMNVDRLWEIYRTQFMNTTDFETDNPNWLDASFIFYDENNQVVKVQVKDALDITKLGYSFADLSVQWKNVSCMVTLPLPITKEARVAEFGSTTRALAEYPIRILVKRPNSSRRKSDIEKTVEVVVVDGIEVVETNSSRFDVYISTPDNSTDFGDFAGSFVTVAHGHEHGKTADSKAKKQILKLGITNLVAELNAETAERLVVTLVPRTGVFLIDGVHIEQNNIK